MKYQIAPPSDLSFRPHGRRYIPEPRESEQFGDVLEWPIGNGKQKDSSGTKAQLPGSSVWQAVSPQELTIQDVSPALPPKEMLQSTEQPNEPPRQQEAQSCPSCGNIYTEDEVFSRRCGPQDSGVPLLQQRALQKKLLDQRVEMRQRQAEDRWLEQHRRQRDEEPKPLPRRAATPKSSRTTFHYTPAARQRAQGFDPVRRPSSARRSASLGATARAVRSVS